MATTTIPIANATIVAAGQAIQVMPIFADPINVVTRPDHLINAYLSNYSQLTPVNRDNDITWFAGDNGGRGFVRVKTSLEAIVLNRTILADPINVIASLSSTSLPGFVFDAWFELATEIEAEFSILKYQKNWVAWSKIGEASFIRDRSNEAGERPMDWEGWAWQVLPLEEMAVVYGDNGICMMYPVDSPAASFGFKNIAKVGIKSPYSVAGSEHVHFFITAIGDLWKLTKQGPEKLGFREYLSSLTNPVLLYEEKDQKLFISDGTIGYVFSSGLGGGYASITGITNNFVTSPTAMVGTPISIMTDTIDLGHRGIKTITFVEVGTDTTEDIFVALDFRYTKDEVWRTSDWVLTNPEGVAKINVAAVEFRVRVKQNVFDELRLDYINLRHQRADRRFLRGPLFEQPDQGEA